MTSKRRAQLRAIGYATRARSEKRRAEYIAAREGGTLDGFKKSKYKKMFWYILATYGERVY